MFSVVEADEVVVDVSTVISSRTDNPYSALPSGNLSHDWLKIICALLLHQALCREHASSCSERLQPPLPEI